MNVARKRVILTCEAGLTLSLENAEVASLASPQRKQVDRETFMQQLEQLDSCTAKRALRA